MNVRNTWYGHKFIYYACTEAESRRIPVEKYDRAQYPQTQDRISVYPGRKRNSKRHLTRGEAGRRS